MAAEPLWLTTSDLAEIHADQLAKFGGTSGSKSLALLESAAAAPINLHLYEGETDLLRLGAQLANAVVRNHPFVDGNKRTSAVALFEFLYLNGLTIELPDSVEAQPLAELFERLASGELGPAELAAALRPHLRPHQA